MTALIAWLLVSPSNIFQTYSHHLLYSAALQEIISHFPNQILHLTPKLLPLFNTDNRNLFELLRKLINLKLINNTRKSVTLRLSCLVIISRFNGLSFHHLKKSVASIPHFVCNLILTLSSTTAIVFTNIFSQYRNTTY